MVEWIRYSPGQKDIWDTLVSQSRSPLFFFKRDYMEYHADRFEDASLIAYDQGAAVAIFPATRNGRSVSSHGGLTFGGIVTRLGVRISMVRELVDELLKQYAKDGVGHLLYKAIPYIFSVEPSQEDIYALHWRAATIVRRDISSVILLKRRGKVSKGRRAQVAVAKRTGVNVVRSSDWEGFHAILSDALRRHGANPVHSSAELELLARRFPDNIFLLLSLHGGEAIAGAVIFDFGRVMHTQYLASSDVGRDVGALDLVIETAIDMAAATGHDYFSFGISSEEGGSRLNTGLIAQKEGFGARGMVVDSYNVELSQR